MKKLHVKCGGLQLKTKGKKVMVENDIMNFSIQLVQCYLLPQLLLMHMKLKGLHVDEQLKKVA